MKIREEIINRMRRLGVRNRAICKDLGFAETNFSAFINGRRGLPYEDLEKLCMYLGLTLESKEQKEDVA